MFQTLSQRMEAMTTDTTTLKIPRKVTNALQSMIMDMAMDTPTLFYPSRPRSSRAPRRPATQRYLQTMRTMDTPMPMPPTVALMGMHTATMIRAPIRRRRVGWRSTRIMKITAKISMPTSKWETRSYMLSSLQIVNFWMFTKFDLMKISEVYITRSHFSFYRRLHIYMCSQISFKALELLSRVW